MKYKTREQGYVKITILLNLGSSRRAYEKKNEADGNFGDFERKFCLKCESSLNFLT